MTFRLDNALLRCIGIFLVTNSHLDHLYPWAALGTGGSLGNAIFFMMSGYGLAASWREHSRPFGPWYWRRFLRIYPSFLICMVFANFWLFGGWKMAGPAGYLYNVIWPTNSAWFIAALMLFYIPLYFIMRWGGNQPRIFLGTAAALFVPYFIWYFGWMDLSRYTIEGPTYFKWIFYFQTMLFGAFLANSLGSHLQLSIFRWRATSDVIQHPASSIERRPAAIVNTLLLLALLALYFLFGYLVHHGGLFTRVQFLVQLVTFPVLLLLFQVSGFIAKRVQGLKPLALFLGVVGSITLEIYLLQGVMYTNKYINALPFPVNIGTFWIGVIAIAWAFAKLADFIRRLIAKLV